MDQKEVTDSSSTKMHEEDKPEVAQDFFMSESDITQPDSSAAAARGRAEDEEADAESALKSVPEKQEPKEIDPAQPFPSDATDGHDPSLQDEKRGVDWPEKAAALKNFVKERGVVVSKVIRRLSGKKEDLQEQVSELTISEEVGKPGGEKKSWPVLSFLKLNPSTELEYVGEKPLVELEESLKLAGRITLFTKSGCAESRLVRSFLREKRLPFVEINLDLFPQRGLDLEERTGTSSVPQVFFNEECIGGIDELNALRNNGELEEKIRKVAEHACPETAPALPSLDEEDGETAPDEFAEVVRQLRSKMQLKDRYYKLRVFSKCFPGSDAVEVFAEDQYCEKDEAVEFGRKVAAKHFFHHVLNENAFEDGNSLYRFLEHDPAVATKCLNFFGATNDSEPKPAAEICKKLTKLLQAIYDRYVSLDGSRVDYYSIATSGEFQRYVKLTEELHRIDLTSLTREEKLAFFLNVHNGLVIHSFILYGRPNGALERRTFFGEIQYLIGGYAYSLSGIENGILRANQRPPYTLTKIFGGKDPRLQVALAHPEPLIHFALSYGTQSSPGLRCYSAESVDTELRIAARDFFDKGGIKIDTEARTVSLSKIMKWYSVDFGKNEREVLHWIAKHIDPTKAEHVLSLMEDHSQVKVNYLPFDWSPNV